MGGIYLVDEVSKIVFMTEKEYLENLESLYRYYVSLMKELNLPLINKINQTAKEKLGYPCIVDNLYQLYIELKRETPLETQREIDKLLHFFDSSIRYEQATQVSVFEKFVEVIQTAFGYLNLEIENNSLDTEIKSLTKKFGIFSLLTDEGLVFYISKEPFRINMNKALYSLLSKEYYKTFLKNFEEKALESFNKESFITANIEFFEKRIKTEGKYTPEQVGKFKIVPIELIDFNSPEEVVNFILEKGISPRICKHLLHKRFYEGDSISRKKWEKTFYKTLKQLGKSKTLFNFLVAKSYIEANKKYVNYFVSYEKLKEIGLSDKEIKALGFKGHPFIRMHLDKKEPVDFYLSKHLYRDPVVVNNRNLIKFDSTEWTKFVNSIKAYSDSGIKAFVFLMAWERNYGFGFLRVLMDNIVRISKESKEFSPVFKKDFAKMLVKLLKDKRNVDFLQRELLTKRGSSRFKAMLRMIKEGLTTEEWNNVEIPEKIIDRITELPLSLFKEVVEYLPSEQAKKVLSRSIERGYADKAGLLNQALIPQKKTGRKLIL